MLGPNDIFLICITLLLFISKVILERQENHGLNLDFFQHDYNATPERAEVLHYNKDYMNRFEIATFKYNRSTTAFNVTMNFKLDDISKLEAIFQAYKFASNEYRLFPMRVEANACEIVKANLAGLGRYSCGNFTGCPMLKGRTYHFCRWTPDQSKMPAYLPNGRYMLECEFQYYSVEVARSRVYGTITRPEV